MLNFVQCLSASTEMNIWFSSFILLRWYIMLIDLYTVQVLLCLYTLSLNNYVLTQLLFVLFILSYCFMDFLKSFIPLSIILFHKILAWILIIQVPDHVSPSQKSLPRPLLLNIFKVFIPNHWLSILLSFLFLS